MYLNKNLKKLSLWFNIKNLIRYKPMRLRKYGFKRSHIPEVAASSPVGPTNDFKGLGEQLPNPFLTLLPGK